MDMARSKTTLLILLGLALTSTLRAQDYRPKVGERHPDFTLPDIQTGKPVSLTDFRGKKVLLIQFASW
jgi:AhpC/TSA family